jgi:hypothetical protein
VADTHLGQMGRLFPAERLAQIVASFSEWRVDSFIREMEAERRKGRVLPFVRGLHLSAQLIYFLRDLLSGSRLTADWGHLLDSTESFCSCECDVIIHKNGQIGRWDGNERPVMDFKFISLEKAVVVISCKSYLRTGDVDKQYCESTKEFVDRVWLFAECCNPRSIESIRNKAERCGYDKFWPLYTWSKKTSPTPNREGWNDFVEEVKRLKEAEGN